MTATLIFAVASFTTTDQGLPMASTWALIHMAGPSTSTSDPLGREISLRYLSGKFSEQQKQAFARRRLSGTSLSDIIGLSPSATQPNQMVIRTRRFEYLYMRTLEIYADDTRIGEVTIEGMFTASSQPSLPVPEFFDSISFKLLEGHVLLWKCKYDLDGTLEQALRVR